MNGLIRPLLEQAARVDDRLNGDFRVLYLLFLAGPAGALWPLDDDLQPLQ